ncbi:TonB-dependent receptor [Tsuneonella deserti]|uniref:TonB-dependent receptor n=1 Tax=Tsuneonella deserti TaxID=2035528 RepID=A0ABQ1S6Z7_9SPHN|nr:TonB-dependent receptor [Tsuneonella deserti]GGD96187.1 TonB-dependent receptor [Tsuneonella deserti]
MSKYLFFLSTLLVSAPLAAQSEETAITVTATGTRSEIEDTGQPVTIIGQAEIDEVQGADPARVLRRAPGVAITRNGPPGAFTGVRVRGAGAEQLLVLVDGVRVADAAAPGGGFDFANLAAGEIEKLDLLRGSNSVIWGSDAIGGVLLVTTRARRGLLASAEYGSDDSTYLSASGGTGSDSFFLGGSAGWQRTDGFSAAASGSEPDGFEQWSANGQARAYLSPSLELFALGRYAKGDLDLDGYPAPDYVFTDTAESQRTRQYTGATGAIYDSGLLYLRGAYSFSDTERATYDPQLGSVPTYSTDGNSRRVDLRGEWRPIGPLILNFGAEGEWTRFASSFDAARKTRIWGAYAQAGIEHGGLSAHAGLRHDRHARFGGETSIGADLSYAVAKDLRLRASYGEGFKAPTLFQLLSEYGNAALRPERSSSFDLGLAWRKRTEPTWGAVTLYRRDSTDLIDFVSCFEKTSGICAGRPLGTYDNIGRARAQGFEVEFGLAPTGRLRTTLAYSYLDAQDRATGAGLARRPRHALTATLDWAAPMGVMLGSDVRLVGDSYDDAGNFVRLDGYVLADLRAAVPLGEQLELFGRIENLFDARYTEVAGYGTRGRAAFAGARLKL